MLSTCHLCSERVSISADHVASKLDEKTRCDSTSGGLNEAFAFLSIARSAAFCMIATLTGPYPSIGPHFNPLRSEGCTHAEPNAPRQGNQNFIRCVRSSYFASSGKQVPASSRVGPSCRG